MDTIKKFIDIEFSDLLEIVDFIDAKDYSYFNSNKTFYENNKDFIKFYQTSKNKVELVNNIEKQKKEFLNNPEILNDVFIEKMSVLNVLFTENHKLNDIYLYIKKGFPLEVKNRKNYTFLQNFSHYLKFMHYEEDINLLKDIILLLHEKNYFKKDNADVKSFLVELISEKNLSIFEALVNNGLDIDKLSNNMAHELSMISNGLFDSEKDVEKQKMIQRIFTVFCNTNKDIFYVDENNFIANFRRDSKNTLHNLFSNIYLKGEPKEEELLSLKELYLSVFKYLLNTDNKLPDDKSKTFEPVLLSLLNTDRLVGYEGLFKEILNKFNYEEQEKIIMLGQEWGEDLSNHTILTSVLFFDFEKQIEDILSIEFYSRQNEKLKDNAFNSLTNIHGVALLHYIIKQDNSLIMDKKFLNNLFENIVACDLQYSIDCPYLDILKVKIENEVLKNSFTIEKKSLPSNRI